jgi:hypothetical protein
MKAKVESAGPVLATLGLAMALFAASPAIKASGPYGLALAADPPPAVAQPEGVANNGMAQAALGDSAAPPAGGPAPAAEAAPAADLMYQRSTCVYLSSRLRDPFGSLLKGRFVADGDERLMDIGSVSLLGVMWGEVDKFAMLEDEEGNGFIVRVGDPVVNGEVAGITRDTVTFRQYFFGTSTTVTLKLKPREVKGNAKNDKR